MNKNIIFEALAFLDNYETSPSVSSTKDQDSIKDIYIKNAIISLVSIREYNKDVDIAIVTNFKFEEKWKKILEENNIIEFNCEFNQFKMPSNIVYSLSYYKLCAFEYILRNTQYDKYCFVDCDTFGVGNFGNIWKEAESAVLLIPNDASVSAKVRKEINVLYEKMNDNNQNIITHYNSAFIAGKREELLSIIIKCDSIHKKLILIQDCLPQGGDEVVWSLALADYCGRLYCPRAYVLLSNIGYREYWIDKSDYRDSEIVIWHLPVEKRYALIWAYNYYIKKKQLPVKEKMAKACRIREIRNLFTLLSIKVILLDKTVLKRNIMKIFLRK